MKRAASLAVLALVAVAGGLWYLRAPAPAPAPAPEPVTATLPDVPECTSCTAEHQGLSKLRAARQEALTP